MVNNAEINRLIKDFIDVATDFRENLRNKSVIEKPDEELLAKVDSMNIPKKGRSAEEVCQEMTDDIFGNIVRGQHPRSFACVPGPASMVSWMGDVMTSAYNPHAGCMSNAPAAGRIEKKLIRWMCDLAGYPEEAGGLFVSGGSMANLTALTAARDSILSFDERPKAVVYMSEQTHSSLTKALLITGFGHHQIRKMPVDSRFRMDVCALEKNIEKDIESGLIPFAVIATAGTTNTGSIDPLKEISSICRKNHMWMHVDGAFGASALVSDKYRRLLQGIELSDSMSWDAHKGLFQTYSCSVVMARNSRNLTGSFYSHPEYLADAMAEDTDTEFWDMGPELTRPARGLKLWTTLQIMGQDAIGKAVEHGYELAEMAEEKLRKCQDWEVVSGASLGTVNFRYVSDKVRSKDLDRINAAAAAAVTASGYAQVYTTELQGKKVMRLCIINPETTSEDVTETLDRLKNAAEEILRGGFLRKAEDDRKENRQAG